jgi:hypothetical protein
LTTIESASRAPFGQVLVLTAFHHRVERAQPLNLYATADPLRRGRAPSDITAD